MTDAKAENRWVGGETRVDRLGNKVWVIKAMRGGQRYSITLDVSNEDDAETELKIFDRDPVGYQEAHDRARAPTKPTKSGPVINGGLLAMYEKDALDKGNQHQITPRSCKANLRYLKKWMVALKGADLSKATLLDYKEALSRIKAPRRQCIAALRAYTHWLRREGRLSSSSDASRDLEVPQGGSKRSKRETGYTIEHVEKVYAAIKSRKHNRPLAESEFTDAQSVRDVLCLRALCGMHHSEIERLAKGHGSSLKDVKGHDEIAGVAVFIHKKGLPHPQALPAKALAAAKRLQARGSAPADSYIRLLMDQAADAAGVERILPSELRHSFVTWGLSVGRAVHPKEGGVSLDLVRRVVGHTSYKTTEIYNGAIPPLVALPINLQNDEDPQLPGEHLRVVGG
jgi:integrase